MPGYTSRQTSLTCNASVIEVLAEGLGPSTSPSVAERQGPTLPALAMYPCLQSFSLAGQTAVLQKLPTGTWLCPTSKQHFAPVPTYMQESCAASACMPLLKPPVISCTCYDAPCGSCHYKCLEKHTHLSPCQCMMDTVWLQTNLPPL